MLFCHTVFLLPYTPGSVAQPISFLQGACAAPASPVMAVSCVQKSKKSLLSAVLQVAKNTLLCYII
jgi:hypothetical protein